jgi:hypothetical protein
MALTLDQLCTPWNGRRRLARYVVKLNERLASSQPNQRHYIVTAGISHAETDGTGIAAFGVCRLSFNASVGLITDIDVTRSRFSENSMKIRAFLKHVLLNKSQDPQQKLRMVDVVMTSDEPDIVWPGNVQFLKFAYDVWYRDPGVEPPGTLLRHRLPDSQIFLSETTNTRRSTSWTSAARRKLNQLVRTQSEPVVVISDDDDVPSGSQATVFGV